MPKAKEIGLKEIPIESIDPGDRYREEYGDINMLAESLRDMGIIQPIAVSTTDEPGRYLLLAGGRRLQAARVLKWTSIPARIYQGPLTELEVREIELEENIQRKDMTWAEVCRLRVQIHELKQQLYGEAEGGVRTDLGQEKKGWSLRDTAKLLGASVGSVATDIKLGKALEERPDLFSGCKTKQDAQKLLAKIAKRAEYVAIAPSVKLTEARLRELADSYILQDFFEGVKRVPEESIDLVEVDPPYGINLREKREVDSPELQAYNEISADEYPEFLARLFRECYRVMAKDSWLICWFAQEPWFETVYQSIKNAGFTVSRMVGVWVKPTGQALNPRFYLPNAVEMFFYARKGNPRIEIQRGTNTFEYTTVSNDKRIHPTERPIELMKDLLKTFARPGARIMVPFAGSGVTLAAAHQLGMTAFGFDLTKAYKDSFIVKLHKGDWQ